MEQLELKTCITACQLEELSPAEQHLVSLAIEATQRSYAPYSHFCVGAAVLLENGVEIIGCNQENAAYPSGLCAERTAVFYAQSRYPEARILKLCIIGKTASDIYSKGVCAPCGACRQVILEAEYRNGAPIEILLPSQQGIYVINGISTLLPFGFSYDEVTE